MSKLAPRGVVALKNNSRMHAAGFADAISQAPMAISSVTTYATNTGEVSLASEEHANDHKMILEAQEDARERRI